MSQDKTDRLGAEAGIVLPDRDITLGHPQTGASMEVTVREYRFRDGLKAQALAGDLIADIAALSDDEVKFSATAMNALFGKHADAWIDLCALATGLGQHEIATLREPDALTLSLAVWEVNSSFFTSRILGETLGRDALTPTRASQTSSTVSPPQDTETPVTS
ncbi:DUF6631 family protein [Tateyamaria sp.]|uniref:DUF6631 family protein n=1 Tax=Tateyamaria sp. TaxID=1929288 RepID=UPI003B20FA97